MQNRTHRTSFPDLDNEPDTFSSHAFTREAVSLIQKHAAADSTAPFFMFLAYTAPHDPLQSPPVCARAPTIVVWRVAASNAVSYVVRLTRL